VLVEDPLAGSANLDWPEFFRKHRELFWELRPDVDLPFRHIGDRTNSLGLRNRDDPSPKGSALRVLCLGASCTYAMGLSIDDTWASQLARRSGYEVINAGVPGYSTYQGRLLYEDRLRELDADVHVLEYGPSDVVTWVSSLDGNPVGLTDEERARQLEYIYVKSRSRVIDWLQSLTLPRPEDLRCVEPIEAGPRVTIDDYRENLAYLASQAPVSVLLVWPLRCQIDPVFQDYFPVERYEAYQQVVRSLADQGHLVLEVEQVFRRSGLPSEQLYLDSVHATVVGCRLIAEAIHKTISRRLPKGAGVGNGTK
jgi:lysophospholipase L1-like esterase